jgi:hypothetical protein
MPPEEELNDEQTVAKENRKFGQRLRERQDFLREILRRKDGREWLYGLLEVCHVYQVNLNTNPHLLYFSEGERNIGTIILAEIVAAEPASYVKMLEEHNPHARSD